MVWMSNTNPAFRTPGAEAFFQQHFRREDAPTWGDLARRLVERVCGSRLGRADRDQLARYIAEMKLMPSAAMLRGTRGDRHAPPGLVVLEGDGATQGDAAHLPGQAAVALGAGSLLAVDYSRTPSGRVAPSMHVVNEIGRAALAQGALGPVLRGRPAAILASLAVSHPDLGVFLGQDGRRPGGDLARLGPFDLTARRVRFGSAWFLDWLGTGDPGEGLAAVLREAMASGSVAIGFDLFEKEAQVPARLSAADVNVSRIESPGELADVTQLAMQFLLCDAAGPPGGHGDDGTQGPAGERRPGLGLMGLHEWLVRRGARYEPSAELGRWLEVWRGVSDETAGWFADALGVRRPHACRAVRPDRVLARLAGTTAGADLLPAVAFRETDASEARMHPLADWLSRACGIDLDGVESGLSLAGDVARLLSVQAQVQSAADQAVTTTIRLPAWGTPGNDPGRVDETARLVSGQAHLLRGVTFEPEGAFGRPPRVVAEPPRKRARAREAA